MYKRCSPSTNDCYPICDFCAYDKQRKPDYGGGFCLKLKKEVDAMGICDDFTCFMLARRKTGILGRLGFWLAHKTNSLRMTEWVIGQIPKEDIHT